MNKKTVFQALSVMLAVMLLLSACTAEPEFSTTENAEVTEASSTAEPETQPTQATEPAATEPVTEPVTQEPTERVKPGQTLTSYTIFEGTDEENEVVVITSDEPGPVFYMVGGIHGNEQAGWKAANELKAEVQLYCGTLYILSPVNTTGAGADTRYPDGTKDLNRAFPGDNDSSDKAKRMAAELMADIKRVHPDFVLDLHESMHALGDYGGNGLGNSIIYSNDELLGDLIFDFTYANQSGDLLKEKFGLTYPGVAKSFNRVITDELGIPVVTTETLRTGNLPERISQQKEIAYFFLNYYGMTDLYNQ